MNIYIHIPFCRSRCAYCSFTSTTELKKKNEYLEALLAEIKSRSINQKDKRAETIYIGGGTPSLLEITELSKILNAVSAQYKKTWGQEITIEVNPEDITEEKLAAWTKLKINRISIGVQTLNDDVRKTIGRSLTAEETLKKIKLSINYFPNINVDLIAGLPGDDVNSFNEGIKQIYKAGVNHISVYDLELDKICDMTKNPKKYSLLSEEQRDEFLTRVWGELDRLGYKQYEISNFSYDKKISKHNWDFWTGKDYIGFGLGATSKINNLITENEKDMSKYLKGEYVRTTEKLNEIEMAKLNIILALRINHKVKEMITKYEKLGRFNLNKEIKYLITEGLIDNKYNLTAKGKLLYNQVIKRLLA